MWRSIYHEFRRWAKASDQAVVAPRRTEITVQTDRVWIIRKSHPKRVWCADCGREVDMVGLKEAEAFFGVNQPLLPDSDGGRGWHWAQSTDGSPLVCLESVLRAR
jgi:hypothetical protein